MSVIDIRTPKHSYKRKSTNSLWRVFVQFPTGGSGGIRTHEPKKDYRISSAARYDHFDTLPYDYRIIISVA